MKGRGNHMRIPWTSTSWLRLGWGSYAHIAHQLCNNQQLQPLHEHTPCQFLRFIHPQHLHKSSTAHLVSLLSSTLSRRKNIVFMEREDVELVEYILWMPTIGHLLGLTQLKLKVVEITQSRDTPFKEGNLGHCCLKWYRKRNLDLAMKVPQGSEMGRVKALCMEKVMPFNGILIMV